MNKLLKQIPLVILAGGEGQRLGIPSCPKPLVSVAGIPLIERQILLAKQYGIKRIYILSHFMAEKIYQYLKDGSQWGVQISHFIEPYPLGTAGALKSLENFIDDDFLLFYGDIVLDINLQKFHSYHQDHYRKYQQTLTLIAHPNDHPLDSDIIEIDDDNFVRKIHPKPRPQSLDYPLPNLVNAAVYMLTPKIFSAIKFGEKSDFAHDTIPHLLKNNHNILTYKTAEYIKDMGSPDRLEKVFNDIFSKKVESKNINYPQKAIFIDRDGVINKDLPNMSYAQDFELLPHVAEAIKLINEASYLAIIITNQPGVAKGILSLKQLSQIHNKMETLLGEHHSYFDAIYFCPHHPELGHYGEVTELKIDCHCRKPKAGMLRNAQANHHIDFNQSWMIGDRDVDIIAGKSVGCQTILISTDSNKDLEDNADPHFVCQDLMEAVKLILSKSQESV